MQKLHVPLYPYNGHIVSYQIQHLKYMWRRMPQYKSSHSLRQVELFDTTQAKWLMAVRECSRTFTMLKRHILYIKTILAMKVHDI